jgi:hypothetical protein
MLTFVVVLAAAGGGVYWFLKSQVKPVARPKSPEAAKRERMQGSPHDSDLRAMRTKNAKRSQFGRR